MDNALIGSSYGNSQRKEAPVAREHDNVTRHERRGDPQRLGETKNYPEEYLAPYKEFTQGGKIYFFTPGGFLYRRDPGTEEVGGFFCGYLTDDVWHYRPDDG